MIIRNLQVCQGTQNTLQTVTNEHNYTVRVGITPQKDVKKNRDLTLSNFAQQATTLLTVKLKTERTMH